MALLQKPVRMGKNLAFRRRWTSVIAPLFLLVGGCVALDTTPVGSKGGVPCQMVATWQPHVYTTQDPVHGGADTPTLIGRVYLFGPEIKYPMAGDGALIVDLYDDSGAPQGTPPVMLEEYRYDPVTLSKLLKRDMVGLGYTVPFMWSRYRPELTRIQMKVRYEPAKGAALYSESGSMAIDNPAMPVTTTTVTQSAKPNK